ncbi:hypothetical protein N9W34_06470 [Rickettsiales bacterium]|nr:hypothetical protein [Rickettsiales bacterium]
MVQYMQGNYDFKIYQSKFKLIIFFVAAGVFILMGLAVQFDVEDNIAGSQIPWPAIFCYIIGMATLLYVIITYFSESKLLLAIGENGIFSPYYGHVNWDDVTDIEKISFKGSPFLGIRIKKHIKLKKSGFGALIVKLNIISGFPQIYISENLASEPLSKIQDYCERYWKK